MTDARADVLLVTATKVESQAVFEAFEALRTAPEAEEEDGRVYFDLGEVSGARVWMTQCEMGSGGLGASQQAVSKGIHSLGPAAVVMVGIAFGMNELIGLILAIWQRRLPSKMNILTACPMLGAE